MSVFQTFFEIGSGLALGMGLIFLVCSYGFKKIWSR